MIKGLKIYKSIIESSHMSFWICDKDLNIVFWNTGAEKIYEYTKEEVLGKYYIDLFVSDYEKEEAIKDDLMTIKEGFVQRNRIAYDKTKFGTTVHMLTNCFPITDENTKEVYKVEIGIEIADLKLKEDEHKELIDIGRERLAKRLEQNEKMTNLVISDINAQINTIYIQKTEAKKIENAWYSGLNEEDRKTLTKTHDENLRNIELRYTSKIYRLNELRDKAVICNSNELDFVKECLIKIEQEEEVLNNE